MNFQCGVPEGNENPTNTQANADSPEGTHDPYGGTTYTPPPSPNAGGMGIAGMNRLRIPRRSVVIANEQGWGKEIWALGWAALGALMVFVL